jgi:hypothetical protein
MTFDLFQLDRLSFDEAEAELENYINGAIEAFSTSPIGQDYLAQHPVGGDWIATFLEIGFLFGPGLPSKMTMANVRDLIEQTLPRKVTLGSPEDAEDAEAEWIAFWTFLRQSYKPLPNAGPIITYLKSIKGRFATWMFDPNRAGLAKSFVIQGQAAGFDMSKQENVDAFKDLYNQQLKNQQLKDKQPQGQKLTSQKPSVLPGLTPASRQSEDLPEPPPEVRQLLTALGIEIPDMSQIADPEAFVARMMAEMTQKMKAIGDDPAAMAQFEAAMAEGMPMRSASDHAEPFPEQLAQILETQVITEAGPGTILQDFERILELLKGQGLPLAKSQNGWALKVMEELNQGLSQPIEHLFQRPVQKSFPPVQGLFMLVRALGISQILRDKKQDYLVLEPQVYAQWKQLNPTERYCTLLEAWLIRAHASILGEQPGMGNFSEGINCLRANLLSGPNPTASSFKSYEDQSRLKYYPGLNNLALMEMFGLVAITSGNPSKGKGWRIQKIEPQPLGVALMELVRRAYEVNDLAWPSDVDALAPFQELQPSLVPYFPEWQQVLSLPDMPFRSDRHLFKVKVRDYDCWLRLAIVGDATLDDLSDLILQAVNFENDHLHQFCYRDEIGREQVVGHPDSDEDQTSDLVTIGVLPLMPGSTIEYLFDFGDCWYFDLELESIEAPMLEPEAKVKGRKKQAKSPIGEVLDLSGKAPKQYGNSDW